MEPKNANHVALYFFDAGRQPPPAQRIECLMDKIINLQSRCCQNETLFV